MISKLNTFLHNDKHEDVYMVKQKVNEIIDTLNNFEAVMVALQERAKRVKPADRPLHEPLTNFGFQPEIYCTCGKNITPCCPVHSMPTGFG